MAYQLVDASSISIAASDEYSLSSRVGSGDSPVAVDVKVASGTGTAFLETSSDGFQTVIQLSNIAIGAPGTFSLTALKENDPTDYPLRQNIRVRIAASADMEVDSIRMCIDK